MPNQLYFNDNNKFIKKLIECVFVNNYFFIVENPLMDIPSKIKFIINIIDEKTNDIISRKVFELYEDNEIEIEDIEEKNTSKDKENILLKKINYNYNKSDFFILDLKEIKQLLIDYENIYNFIFNIVNNFNNIKIILIIDENINGENKNEILIIKQLIDLCDIIFCFKNNMNKFLKSFYAINKRNIQEKSPSKIFFLSKNNNSLNDLDLITKDFCKYRQNIPRLTIIFEEFNLIHIYKQEFSNKSLSYHNIFPLLLNTENALKNKKEEFIYSNSNKLYHIFIGGFLSRYIYNKSFDICLKAGKFLMIKAINIFISKKEIFTNQNDYNIEIKTKNMHLNEKIKNLLSKEKHFILDCTNKAKSQKKEYNILTDNNCLGFLTKKFYSKNEKKSLKERIDIFLKKKKKKDFKDFHESKNKINYIIKIKEDNFSKKKIKRLLPFITINDIDQYTNSNTENNLFKKSKTISYDFNSKNIQIKHNYKFNQTSYSFNKKNKDKNRLIKNILINIHRTENYNKYLYKMYQPNKNFDNFINEYNNLHLKYY